MHAVLIRADDRMALTECKRMPAREAEKKNLRVTHITHRAKFWTSMYTAADQAMASHEKTTFPQILSNIRLSKDKFLRLDGSS